MPTPGTAAMSSSDASCSAAIDPKWRASSWALTAPTCGMPSPNSTAPNGRSFDFSIDAITLAADRSWKPSSSSSCSAVSRYRSLGRWTIPSSNSRTTSFSPTPSMSSAPRDTKCLSSSAPRLGQRGFTHRCWASPSGFAIGWSQAGQRSGMRNTCASSGRRSSTGPTTCGITSPARWTITVSPMRTSLRWMFSSLCSVASLTMTPPTSTGSRIAYGFSAPVRPTLTPMSSSFVVRVVAGNLNATAQRGSRPTEPSARCIANESTFTTTPSISYGSDARSSPTRRHSSRTPSMESWIFVCGLTGNWRSRSQSSAAWCESNSTPSRAPTA